LHLISSVSINNIIVKDAYDYPKLIQVEGIGVRNVRGHVASDVWDIIEKTFDQIESIIFLMFLI